MNTGVVQQSWSLSLEIHSLREGLRSTNYIINPQQMPGQRVCTASGGRNGVLQLQLSMFCNPSQMQWVDNWNLRH